MLLLALEQPAPKIIASKIYSTTMQTYPLPLLLQLQFGFTFVLLQEFEQAIIAPPYILYIGTKYNN